jgi:hypothetical protein
MLNKQPSHTFCSCVCKQCTCCAVDHEPCRTTISSALFTLSHIRDTQSLSTPL